MTSYSGLRRAQLSLDYLHANSTTHEFLFGALAEMIDNSRDAQATQLEIYDYTDKNLRGGFGLCFLDDGEGMLPEEAARVVTFGYSEKRAKSDNLIGMYGNGLKSGSMRIGNDLILFTKKQNLLTILFLSRTFHESEHLVEVVVPVPSFDATTRRPTEESDPELHRQEIDIILKHSPFKTTAELMSQFDRIHTESGTLVIVFNLKLLDTGEPELQFNGGDIILANPPGHEFDSDEKLHDEQRSFAAYCSILYMDPRMKIYIQSVKVRTRKLLADLYKPKMYKYSSARFKTRSEAELKKIEADASKYDYLAREAESKARDLQKKCVAQLSNMKLRHECRRADEEASRLRQQAQLYKMLGERKKREMKDPKTLNLYIGMQINHRDRDGAFIYNCSRLISMYHRMYDGVPRGLVAIVDVPYLVLEPTHNKQDFADAKEFRHLLRALSEHALSYCRDLGLNEASNAEKFWTDFGYTSKEWAAQPSDEAKFLRKRRAEVPTVIQCDSCLKWRILPFSINPPLQYPSDWHCAMNPDPNCNRCGAVEVRHAVPEGVFQRPVATAAETADKLQEEIRRKQAQLAKIQPEKMEAKNEARHDSESLESEDEQKKSPRKPNNDVANSSNHESPSRQLRSRGSGNNHSATKDDSGGESDSIQVVKRQKVAEKPVPVLHGRLAFRSGGKPTVPEELSEEEEEEEEEEEDEEQRPVKRHSSPKRSSKRPARGKSRDKDDDDDEDEEEEEEDVPSPSPAKRRSLSSKEGSNLSPAAVSILAENYRSCIRYFLPPSWKKFNKESVANMSPSKLVTFPQQEFFDEYERGLKSLVGKLRDENSASKKQLLNLRRMVAALLECILNKPDGTLLKIVTDNPDSREIDELLKTCVDKTRADGKKSSGASSSSSKKGSR